jgi:hypothetical protein
MHGETVKIGLITFGKLGTGSKERISGSIPFLTGPLKTGTNYLQKELETFLCEPKIFRKKVRYAIINGVK